LAETAFANDFAKLYDEGMVFPFVVILKSDVWIFQQWFLIRGNEEPSGLKCKLVWICAATRHAFVTVSYKNKIVKNIFEICNKINPLTAFWPAMFK
jgi:hypothetical protein